MALARCAPGTGRGGVLIPLAAALGVVHGVRDPGLPAHRDQRGRSARRFGGQVRDEDAEMAYGGDSVRVIH
jgi:hypothetical protein